jgi:ankyrin repeat protein
MSTRSKVEKVEKAEKVSLKSAIRLLRKKQTRRRNRGVTFSEVKNVKKIPLGKITTKDNFNTEDEENENKSQRRKAKDELNSLIKTALFSPNKDTKKQDTDLVVDYINNDHDHLLVLNKKLDNNDEEGNTALILACMYGNIEIAQTLINHGADINRANKSHKTALDYARENGHTKIVELLERSGAHATSRPPVSMTVSGSATSTLGGQKHKTFKRKKRVTRRTVRRHNIKHSSREPTVQNAEGVPIEPAKRALPSMSASPT